MSKIKEEIRKAIREEAREIREKIIREVAEGLVLFLILIKYGFLMALGALVICAIYEVFRERRQKYGPLSTRFRAWWLGRTTRPRPQVRCTACNWAGHKKEVIRRPNYYNRNKPIEECPTCRAMYSISRVDAESLMPRDRPPRRTGASWT
jgi:hypothetical protein